MDYFWGYLIVALISIGLTCLVMYLVIKSAITDTIGRDMKRMESLMLTLMASKGISPDSKTGLREEIDELYKREADLKAKLTAKEIDKDTYNAQHAKLIFDNDIIKKRIYYYTP